MKQRNLMHFHKGILNLFLLGILLINMSCDSSSSDSKDEFSTITEAIDDYLNKTQEVTKPGLSILVQKKGNIIYKASKGYRVIDTKKSIDEDTQFRIASITKPITAIAIMMLVQDGKLALNNKVSEIIDGLPSSYSQITIEHLLSHRSGLLDYLDDIINRSELNNLTNEDILGRLKGSGLENLQFTPGTSGDYSNTGYVLLAMVIEKISGKKYPEFLDSTIFSPLGMTQSFVITKNEQLGDHGDNYALAYGNTHLVFGFNSLIYGANGLVSTTHDLLLFVNGLLSGKLISLETQNLMTKSYGPLSGIADYGLGWMTGTGSYWHTNKYSDKNDFWHTGGYDGYRTVLSINPDSDLQVIILTNNGDTSQKQMFDILELTRRYAK